LCGFFRDDKKQSHDTKRRAGVRNSFLVNETVAGVSTYVENIFETAPRSPASRRALDAVTAMTEQFPPPTGQEWKQT